MPESKDISNKKNTVAKKEQTAKREPRSADAPNPVWFKPVMFGFMLLGLVWIVTYYVTSSTLSLPVPALGQNNIFVGFGIMFIGFLMTTRWR
jgi:hypothetical protein